MGKIPDEMSPSVENMQIGYIRPYHREIARRLVLGQRQVDIAHALGLTQGRVSIIVNSPLFKMELKRLERMRDEGVADVQRTLQEVSPIALEVLERTMYSARSERLRYDAASSILDRAGHGAIGRQAIHLTGSIKYGDIEGMTDEELRAVVRSRVERMNALQNEKEKEIIEAKGVEITWEQGNGCPIGGDRE